MFIFRAITLIILCIVTFFSGLFSYSKEENCYAYNDLRYGLHERNNLDLRIPKGKDEVGLILYIHGGAWIGGDKSVYTDMIDIACDKGYACAAVNYSYINEKVDINDIMDDIQQAVEVIYKTAKKHDVKISKMLLNGGSAGGHLSLLYGYSRADASAIKPACVVSDCGPSDLCDDNLFYGCGEGNGLGDYNVIAELLSWACGQELTYETRAEAREALEKVSPVYYVNENTVPTVINHGMVDNIVPYSAAITLDKALTEYGVTHVLNPYPNSGHGLDNDPESIQRANELFWEYAETYLK